MKRVTTTLALAAALAAGSQDAQAQGFGRSVAVSGDQLLVGQVSFGQAPGTVYVYQRRGEVWEEAGTIQAPGAEDGDGFGWSLSTDGDRLLVAALNPRGGGGSGVHVFARSGGSWSSAGLLESGTVPEGASAGVATAIHGDIALVTVGSLRGQGVSEVHVFRNGYAGWTRTGNLTAPESAGRSVFGSSLAFGGQGEIFVGDPLHQENAGVVYVYREEGGSYQLATQLTANYLTSTRGSTFVAIDGSGETAHVFDARLNRWATVVGQGPLTLDISRHNAMAYDSQFGYGFGQPSGEWYKTPLTAVPSGFKASSSIGTIIHGTQVSVYSVQGSFSYTGRYPEFTQTINLGNTIRLHQVAPPGSSMGLLVGVAPAYIDLGPILGRLYIEPTGLIQIPWPVSVGATGIAELAIPVPNDPSLRYQQIHFQDIVFPPLPAQPWLSSSVAPIFF